MLGADPLASGKLEEQCSIEAARGAIIDILDAGGLAQLGGACPALEALLPAQRRFLVEQQAQPFGMFEAADLRLGYKVLKPLGHAVQAEIVQLVERRVGKHKVVPFSGSIRSRAGCHGWSPPVVPPRRLVRGRACWR